MSTNVEALALDELPESFDDGSVACEVTETHLGIRRRKDRLADGAGQHTRIVIPGHREAIGVALEMKDQLLDRLARTRDESAERAGDLRIQQEVAVAPSDVP